MSFVRGVRIPRFSVAYSFALPDCLEIFENKFER